MIRFIDVWLVAFFKVGIKIVLPIPEAGETFEDWLGRAALCKIPIVRWLCAGDTVRREYDSAKHEAAAFDQEIANLTHLVGLTRQLVQYEQQNLEYWRSPMRFRLLEDKRSALLGRFSAAFESQVEKHYPSTGAR